MKFYMLDNHDSFVYNLAAYVRQEGEEIVVESVDTAEIERIGEENYDGLILSPGPGKPEHAKKALELMRCYAGKIPILGVCLGHQIIAHHYGAVVGKAVRPMHGKRTKIRQNGGVLFRGLPGEYTVTRYHSLVVKTEVLPSQLRVDAVTKHGEVMAISHRTLPVYGVQFHPEAVLTEYGHELIRNFLQSTQNSAAGQGDGMEREKICL